MYLEHDIVNLPLPIFPNIVTVNYKIIFTVKSKKMLRFVATISIIYFPLEPYKIWKKSNSYV